MYIMKAISLSCLIIFIPSISSFQISKQPQSFGLTETSSFSRQRKQQQQQQPQQQQQHVIDSFQTSYRPSSSTSLNSFLGSDGGLLGVGTPELFTILLVGYFVLGPSDLYKLVKEIGKFIQNIRTLGTDAAKTFESTMEDTIQVTELRNAQRELTDAFSFRRSINSDDDTDDLLRQPNMETNPPPLEDAATTSVAAAVGTEGETTTKKRKRRRVKKKKQPIEEEQPPQQETTEPFIGVRRIKDQLPKEETPAVVGNVPDLSMDDAIFENKNEELDDTNKVVTPASELPLANDDWFNDDIPSFSDTATTPLSPAEPPAYDDNSAESGMMTPEKIAAQQRFQAQLSGTWNDKVVDNTEELQPLAMIMERLALLEEEKKTADSRLEEEFRLREELEEKFYREKRALLEETAVEIQSKALVS